MDILKEDLVTEYIFGTVGIIIGLAGLIITFLSLRSKKIVLLSRRYTIQTKEHPKVSIYFEEVPISNLSRTVFVYFNSGRKEIRESDIPKGYSPSINFFEGNKILSHGLLIKSGNINFSATQLNENKIEFNYDYLNHNDGFIYEVLYEAKEYLKENYNFESEIIGGKKLKRQILLYRRSLKTFIPELFILIAGVLGFFFLSTVSSEKLGGLEWLYLGMYFGLFLSTLAFNFNSLWNYYVLPKFAKDYISTHKKEFNFE